MGYRMEVDDENDTVTIKIGRSSFTTKYFNVASKVGFKRGKYWKISLHNLRT